MAPWRRWSVSLATAAFAAAASPVLCAQSLSVRADPGRIRVSSPRAHFLEGRPLERLRNGAPVVFAIQLSLLSGSRGNILARAAGRFAISFDIWEEKYAVTRLTNPRKSVSHLTSQEAEFWCLDTLMLVDAGLSADASFYVRLDVRAEQPDDAPAPNEEMGVTLARLVELFSRPQHEGEAITRLEAGPLRLRDLR